MINRTREPRLNMPNPSDSKRLDPQPEVNAGPSFDQNLRPSYPPQQPSSYPSQASWDHYSYAAQGPQHQQPYYQGNTAPNFQNQAPQGYYPKSQPLTSNMMNGMYHPQQQMTPSHPPVDEGFHDPAPMLRKTSSWRILVAIGGLIFIAFVSWVAYRFVPSSDEPTPLIEAQEGPYKIKPENPGGMVIAHQDKLIYDQLNRHSREQQTSEAVTLLPDEPSIPTATDISSNLPPQAESGGLSASSPESQPPLNMPLSKLNTPPQEMAASQVVEKQQHKPASIDHETKKPKAAPSKQDDIGNLLTKLDDIQEIKPQKPMVYFLQMATLPSEVRAIEEMRRLKAKLNLQNAKWHTKKQVNAQGATQYTLIVGPYKTRAEAEKRSKSIKQSCRIIAAQ